MEYSKKSWFIFSIISMLLSLSMADGSSSSGLHDGESLEALFVSYANETLSSHHDHTGTINNITLPWNFSNIQVSVVRLRSTSFWVRGVNLSYFHFPPRIFPMPYTKRIAILYYDLANFSSHYYQIPNYTFLAPVVGFNVYDASNISTLSNHKLTFKVMANPISIVFPDLQDYYHQNSTLQCVKFDGQGSYQFSTLTKANTCVTQTPGHFSIVLPSVSPPPPPVPVPVPVPEQEEKEDKRGWVIGLVVGLLGLVFLVVAIFVLVRRKRIREMEIESEKGVAMDTIWIGTSRMPSAAMLRTQPVLEHEYVP